MNSTVSTIIKVVLLVAIVILGYYLYEIIQKPIRFENIKEKRYEKIQTRLEHIRDAQKAYRAEYNSFAKDFNTLISFLDTGKQAIIERKDSSFMYYDEVYQQERRKDTIITRVLGYRDVKKAVFGEQFDASRLQYIPFTDQSKFVMDAGKIQVNDVTVPVFEAKAPNEIVFEDVIKEYKQFIDLDYALSVGSMNEPTLSGNWR